MGSSASSDGGIGSGCSSDFARRGDGLTLAASVVASSGSFPGDLVGKATAKFSTPPTSRFSASFIDEHSQ